MAKRLSVILAILMLAGCATPPDMSRREASNITKLAIILGPRP